MKLLFMLLLETFSLFKDSDIAIEDGIDVESYASDMSAPKGE